MDDQSQKPAPNKANLEYQTWVAKFDTLTAEDCDAMAAALGERGVLPLISIVMTGDGTTIGSAAERSRTLASIQAQIYREWEVVLPLGSEQPDQEIARVRNLATTSFDNALAATRGEYIAFVEAGDTLPRHALASMAMSLPMGPCALYSDEDEIDNAGVRRNPYFKTDWNPDLFLGQDYVCRLAIVRRTDAIGRGRGLPTRRAVYDLLLQITGSLTPGQIVHVPHVLYHRRADARLAADENQLMRRSVEEFVHSLPRRPGFPAPQVTSIGPGVRRVDWGLPVDPPRVSVIIPTRDKVDLLRTCVEGLRFDTDYPDIEILILDNDSVELETHRYFRSLAADRRVRIIPYAGSFNYSAINNHGVRHATGALIALLNNDLKIHEPGWLRAMASQALRPGIGAVGAMLWYDNGTVQHAGVNLGIGGIASHIFKRYPAEGNGYNMRLKLAQDFSAVTAACMVMLRVVWDEVGGLDEGLMVSYNDVDLCLRIRKAGYRVIWTPGARLYHLESASRGLEDNPEKLARFDAEKTRMRRRWDRLLNNDPFYNPNLSFTSTSCQPAFPPRVQLPWQRVHSSTT